jgi:hypothetical protein
MGRRRVGDEGYRTGRREGRGSGGRERGGSTPPFLSNTPSLNYLETNLLSSGSKSSLKLKIRLTGSPILSHDH